MSALYFDLEEKKKLFPDSADSLIVDMYLSDNPQGSVRLFRVYQQVPEHYHKQCDEVLIVIAGELEFKTDGEPAKVLSKDQLVIFRKNTIHSIKPGGDNPVYFLSIDTPRREASDIYFIDPAHNGLKFISHIGER